MRQLNWIIFLIFLINKVSTINEFPRRTPNNHHQNHRQHSHQLILENENFQQQRHPNPNGDNNSNYNYKRKHQRSISDRHNLPKSENNLHEQNPTERGMGDNRQLEEPEDASSYFNEYKAYDDQSLISIKEKGKEGQSKNLRGHRSEAEDEIDYSSDFSSSSNAGCVSCKNNKELESKLSEEMYREMRLEVIKKQILKKLRLKKPPETEGNNDPLPQPLYKESVNRRRKNKHFKRQDRDIEDYYGKTEQIVIFPDELMPSCITRKDDPSACFKFNLPKEIKDMKIKKGELWVYKLPDESDERNQTLWVSEVFVTENNQNVAAIDKFIDIRENIKQKEGWMNFDISHSLIRWYDNNAYSHNIQIGCKTCKMSSLNTPIITTGEYRPFFVAHTTSLTQKKRNRRNINCSPDYTECCRESFVVSFKEIGWDSWIIGPSEFNAYYCRGSCISQNGITSSQTSRTSIVQKYIRTHGINNNTIEIVPCCTATKMSSMSIIYRDSNITIKVEQLPNMAIDSCGCL